MMMMEALDHDEDLYYYYYIFIFILLLLFIRLFSPSFQMIYILRREKKKNKKKDEEKKEKKKNKEKRVHMCTVKPTPQLCNLYSIEGFIISTKETPLRCANNATVCSTTP